MTPEYILFAQHGWADDNRAMMSLAKELAADSAKIIAPSLNYAMTWLRIEPLIHEVEKRAILALVEHPESPLRIIGHSMGGVIWLEILHRHPDWQRRVEFLTLIAAPVGGANLGRIIDPLQMGVGIAADLGKDRRSMAAAIAADIQTLVLAGDIGQGSDGTIPVESTKVPHAQYVLLTGLSHAAMRYHPSVIERIQQFWQGGTLGELITVHPIVETIRGIPGMTDAHLRGFGKATPLVTLDDGVSIRVWRNPLGIEHVFVASPHGRCLYGGYVGWLHTQDLWQTLQKLQAKETVTSLHKSLEPPS